MRASGMMRFFRCPGRCEGIIRLALVFLVAAGWFMPATALAQGGIGEVVAWTGFTPAAPKAGDTVTAAVRVTNGTPNSQILWVQGTLTWLRPDGTELGSSTHMFNLGYGQFKDIADTRTLAGPGTYTLKFRMLHPSGVDHTTNLAAAPLYPQSAAEVKAALDILWSNFPLTPKAAMYSHGMPDRAETVTITAAVTNVDPLKTVQATTITYMAKDAAGQTWVNNQWSLPALNPGASQVLQFQYKPRNPGEQTVQLWATFNGPGYLLSSHPYQAVPVDPPTTLTGPSVTPWTGSPKTTFTWTVAYTSPANTAPTAVKIGLGGQLYAMQKANPADTNYADGALFRYSSLLPLGSYNVAFYAYQGQTQVASANLQGAPVVEDKAPPVIPGGGQAQPDLVVRDASSVTLSGTAADGETAVARVEWSLDGVTWTPAQGTTAWQFTHNTGFGDQAYGTKTYRVRAVDTVGNATPAAAQWTRKVVWDRRHPKIEEVVVTAADRPVKPAAVYADRPPDQGDPTKGNPYYIAFRVRNPHPTETFRFLFQWSEYKITWEPKSPPWPVNMDNPSRPSGFEVTLGPGQSAWVWTWGQQDWNWIPETSIGSFLGNLVLMFIPEATGILDAAQFASWADTIRYAVTKATVETGRGASMGATLHPSAASRNVTVRVSYPKVAALFGSVVSNAAALTATVAATAMSWTVIGGATGYVLEALLFAESYALYNCAWDPDPDFTQPVRIERIRLPEIPEIKDRKEQETIRTAVTMLENTRAMTRAYARHLGALKKEDLKAAQARAAEAARFARDAAKAGEAAQAWLKREAVPVLKRLRPEEREKLLKTFDGKYLPTLERDLLTLNLGFTAKEVDTWAKTHQGAVKQILERPDLGAVAAGRAVETLNKMAGAFEALAK